MGVGVENMSGDFLHQATHELENYQAGGDNNEHYDDIARSKEDEFKEVTNEWNSEGGSHNADDGDEETGAELVDKNGNSGELGVRKALEVGDNREGSHAERNGDANWERIGEDVFGKVVFDAVCIMLKGEDEAWETDAGEV